MIRAFGEMGDVGTNPLNKNMLRTLISCFLGNCTNDYWKIMEYQDYFPQQVRLDILNYPFSETHYLRIGVRCCELYMKGGN